MPSSPAAAKQHPKTGRTAASPRFAPWLQGGVDEFESLHLASTFNGNASFRIWSPIYRRLEEGYELPQFKCVEFVEEMMYGQYRKGGEFEQRLRQEMLEEAQSN